jgi:hypothetical protein
MQEFLAALVRESGRLWLGSIGRSTQGRDIPILYLTAEGVSDPVAIRQLGRPIFWLMAQQHGNEPAGGEAMLCSPRRWRQASSRRCSARSAS